MKQLVISLTENAHPHAEMMITKASDMSLVAFVNSDNKWYRTNVPSWTKEVDYFLCLPKHKDVCLHYLNGGEIQYKIEHRWIDDCNRNGIKWARDCGFMKEDFEVRIKPKKEKRWIAVNVEHSETDQVMYETEVEPLTEDWQVIEIEVEV